MSGVWDAFSVDSSDIGASISAVQDGDTLHVAVQNLNTSGMSNVRDIVYRQYNMSTHAWVGTGVTVSSISDAGTYAAVSIVRRSNGHLIILGQKVADSVMGVSYDRIGYYLSTNSGASWSSAVAIDASAAPEKDHTGPSAVVGASDRVHFHFRSLNTTGGGTRGYFRTLSSTNVLDTAQENEVGVHYYRARGAYDGTQVHFIGGAERAAMDSTANPTITISAIANPSTTPEFTSVSQPNQSIVAANSSIYMVYSDNSTKDLWRGVYQDGSWVYTEILDNTTISRVTSNPIAGGIGFVYSVGGTLYYDKYLFPVIYSLSVNESSHATFDDETGVFTAPGNVVATPTGQTSVQVTWDAVAGASSYDIERDSVVVVQNHPGSQYDDTGLDPVTEYTYRVRAVK